jgi:hypothetical protein
MAIKYLTIDVRTTRETTKAVPGYRTPKAPPFLLFFLLLSVIGFAGQDDTSEIKRLVEECTQALITGKYAKFAELSHPKIVEMAGGKEKMIAELEKAMAKMKSDGASFSSVTVSSSIEVSTIDEKKFAIVPFVLKINVPGGLLTRNCFMIGVDGDLGLGKHGWTFIDGTNKDESQLKQVIPEAVGKLKIPASEPPVFEKKE